MYGTDSGRGFWNWSLPLGRVAGIPISAHWTLLLIAAFDAFQAVRAGVPWWWLPVLLLVPAISVLLHEVGHAVMARLAGGEAHAIILWMFGGAAMCSAPATPGRQFAVAAAGPAVSLAIAAACLISNGITLDLDKALGTGGVLSALLAFTARFNLMLVVFNLLPCYPMDGGRMLRAVLWPLVGRRRAVRWTLTVAWICLGLGLAWALWSGSIMLGILVIMLAMTVYTEQMLASQGHDPEFGEADLLERRGTWWDRMQARRAERVQERSARVEADEQAVLDRLLEKVSREGLPSLTDRERRQLKEISERRRRRGG
jgi:Zn-dependent protease